MALRSRLIEQGGRAFTYLAMNRGPHTRGWRLLLWPDSANARSPARLPAPLHQALGSDAGQWLESDGDRLRYGVAPTARST